MALGLTALLLLGTLGTGKGVRQLCLGALQVKAGWALRVGWFE